MDIRPKVFRSKVEAPSHLPYRTSKDKQKYKALRKIPTENNHPNCPIWHRIWVYNRSHDYALLFSCTRLWEWGKGKLWADDILITWACWIFILTSVPKHLGHTHFTSHVIPSPLLDMFRMIGNDITWAFPKMTFSGDLLENIVSYFVGSKLEWTCRIQWR